MGWSRKTTAATVVLAMEEHRRQVGERIRQLREQKSLSQRELADLVGVTEKTIGRWENGRHSGYMRNLRELAKALDVQAPDILGRPPAPLGLGHREDDDPAVLLRQLLERQELVERALVRLTREIDSLRRQEQPGRRRAS